MKIFLLILSWISTFFRNEWHDNYSSVRRNLQSSRWLFTNFLRLRSRTPLYRWPVHMYHRCWRRWYIDLSANFKNLYIIKRTVNEYAIFILTCRSMRECWWLPRKMRSFWTSSLHWWTLSMHTLFLNIVFIINLHKLPTL